MKKQEEELLYGPEDVLAQAERLASRVSPAAASVQKPALRPWMGYGLCALGGAGLTGLCWWASVMG